MVRAKEPIVVDSSARLWSSDLKLYAIRRPQRTRSHYSVEPLARAVRIWCLWTVPLHLTALLWVATDFPSLCLRYEPSLHKHICKYALFMVPITQLPNWPCSSCATLLTLRSFSPRCSRLGSDLSEVTVLWLVRPPTCGIARYALSVIRWSLSALEVTTCVGTTLAFRGQRTSASSSNEGSRETLSV